MLTSNSAAKVEAQMSRWVKDRHFEGMILEEDLPNCACILDWMRHAVHFTAPANGRFFDDNLKGIMDMEVHLPFPLMTLEFEYDETFPVDQKGVTHEDRIQLTDKRLLLCRELTMEQFVNDEIIVGEISGWTAEQIERTRTNLWDGIDCEKVIQVFFFAEAGGGGGWGLHPFSWLVPSAWDIAHGEKINAPEKPVELIGKLLAALPKAITHLFKKHGKDRIYHDAREIIGAEALPMMEMCEALTCSNVKIETLQKESRANKKRRKKGKLPLYETKILTVDVHGERRIAALGEDGSGESHSKRSPRQHLRRGHIRRLQSDKRVWVQSCVVGARRDGYIDKRYELTRGAA